MNTELSGTPIRPHDILTITAVQKETKNALIIIALLFLASIFILCLMLVSASSLQNLSKTKRDHIKVWEQINDQVIHVSSYQQLSKLHALKIRHRIQKLIDREALLQRKINQLVNNNMWYAQLLLGPEQIVTLRSKPANRLITLNMLNTFQTVPLSLLQTGYSNWDLAHIVSVRSGKNLKPLHKSANIVDVLQGKIVDVLWIVLLGVLNINLINFLWIWSRTLKPTFLELKESMAREWGQLQKKITAERAQIEQEKEIGILLNNLPGLVISIDTDFKIVTANRLYKEYFGIDPDTPLKRVPLKEVVGQDNWLKIRPQLQKVFKGKKVVYDIEIELPSGSRFFRATYAPGLKKDGLVDHVFALIVDIHDRRLLEESLRKSEINTRITLESIGDAVISTDQRDRIMRMNRVAEDLTKWEFNSAAGQPITNILNLIDKKNSKKLTHLISDLTSLRKSESFSRNILLIAKDGLEHDIAFTKSPIIGSNNKTVGSVIVFRNISKEIALNDQLIASEKMRSVGLLASGISHDFNNILGAIQGAAECLLLFSRDKLTSKESSMLESILDAVQRGSDLSVKLVELTKT